MMNAKMAHSLPLDGGTGYSFSLGPLLLEKRLLGSVSY